MYGVNGVLQISLFNLELPSFSTYGEYEEIEITDNSRIEWFHGPTVGFGFDILSRKRTNYLTIGFYIPLFRLSASEGVRPNKYKKIIEKEGASNIWSFSPIGLTIGYRFNLGKLRE